MLLALLSCGGLYLLLSPGKAPDPIAELKQLPVYPNAITVLYYDPTTDTGYNSNPALSSGPGSIAISRFGTMSLRAPDDKEMVLDFYMNAFRSRGFTCDVVSNSPYTGILSGSCRRMDQGIPTLVINLPSVEIHQPVSWRIAGITVIRPDIGPPLTDLNISYEYIRVQ
ncbi:MAG: hypothetical protein M3441_08480 [Chloroflexota bacterium]|nr:hypothetical protein [Chloroflexota bacterium]